ncbi:hypothetical protein Acr_05g0004560 [Actinidia rufa]|uniref:Gamete-expressed 3 n=1 Tax=Actinidia rufa TaxID=165716 RepID=A0A7J0EMK5_9ERIC|nr:hypothetical protein Acr_05g0004560 [Actinidia rufa]
MIFLLFVQSALTISQPQNSPEYPPNPHLFSVQEPWRKSSRRLSKPLIRDDGRIYSCSERNLFAFESNGYIAWSVNLNYSCNVRIAPVHGGSRKIFLVAENRVLRINPLNIGTYEPAVEVFFGPGLGEEGGEFIGIAISNTLGELYALSVRTPNFKWVQDFSSLDKSFTITPGNNGRLYVIVAVRALVLALDVFTGTVLWQRRLGPLSTPECAPVIDSNGWISIGSLDGFVYSFSPTGVLKKFPKAAALDSVIQVSPLLDCSGYAVYLSQTVMEGKTSHTIGEYNYISALKPLNVVFTLLVPETGSIYWHKSYSELGQFLSVLSEGDLQHFVVDEGILLAFITASSQKLASSCSQAEPKHVSIYKGNEKAIIPFLVFESATLIVLVVVVRFCCVFWRKKKLQSQNLGKFLEKRRSLRLQKKAFDRTIMEIGQKAAEEAVENEMLEKLGDLVKQKEGIERKLSTTYSLGRDRTSSKPKSILPLYDGKTKSYSFQGAKKESVTMFHTLSDTSADSSSEQEVESSFVEDKDTVIKEKGKAKVPSEDDNSSDDDETSEDYEGAPSGSRGFVNPLFVRHDFDESKEVKMEGESGSSSIRRATSSSS